MNTHVQFRLPSRLFLLSLVVIGIVGCSLNVDPTPAPRPTPTPASTQVREVTPTANEITAPATPSVASTRAPLTTVRVGTIDEPASWAVDGPALSSPTAAVVGRLIGRAPAALTTDWRLSSDLAAWEWESNELIITLDENATWSDGSFVSVDDLTASIEQARDAGTFAYHADDSTPTGERALRVSFDTEPAVCAAATEILRWPILESSTWPPPATTGPYTVASQDDSRWSFQPVVDGLSSIELERFDQAPALEQAWREGHVDLIVGDDWLMGQPPPSTDAGTSTDVAGPLLATLAFRLDHPILDDVNVRTALALATDRAALYSDAYGGTAPGLTALLPPNHWAAPAEGPATGDLTAARDTLERAGWRDRDEDGVRENADGESLQLTLVLPLSQTDARWEQLGPALQRQWAEAGVDLELLYQEPVPFEERIHRPAWDVALMAFNVSADPDQAALWSAPEKDILSEDLNVMGYTNSMVQRLMEQAGTVAGCDPEQRAPLYHQAWDIINEDLPMVVLFPLPTRIFVGSALGNVNLDYWPPADICSLLPCQ